MARKKSFFGTLIKLGGLAAAGYAVYAKREEIKNFVTDAAGRLFPEEAETPVPEDVLDVEPDVVIDATGKTATEETTKKTTEEATKETEEDAPEA